MAEIEGPTVRLRTPGRDDLELLAGWYNDPERVAPFDRFTLEPFDGFVRSVEAAPGDPASLAPRFVIVRKPEGDVVGAVGHYRAHPVLESVDVWYLLGRPELRGRGIGSEAVGLLVGHLFATETVERVGATCDIENVASAKLLERLGFRREGTMVATLFHHGRWHDVHIYGVTRSEWSSRGSRAPG